MTRFTRLNLGFVPLAGKESVNSTSRFKEQLLSLQAKPATVSLLTVRDVDTQRRGVEAFYDADDPAAREWVLLAESLAPEIWLKLAERRTAKAGAVRG